MNYVGDFAEDSTVNFIFTTNDSSGAAVAPSTAFEAADVLIYKDNSAIQKTSTNGVTMTSPFDTITGVHQVSVDTSNDTGDAGFWVTGSDYYCVLSPDETVDGQTVAAVVCHFSIENRLTSNIYSDTTVIASDVVIVVSDTAAIHSDTTIISSQTTVIESDSIIVESSVQAVEAWGLGSVASDTTAIESELIQVHSETTAIQSDTTQIDSSVLVIETWGLGSVASDTAAIESELIVVHSETTAIQGATGGTPAATLVDLIWDEPLTGATHAVADSSGRRIRDLQELGVYEDGAIWIDTVNGSPGTTDYESGTVFNPVNGIADANTLATSLGISRFRIAPNSSITFAATQANQEFLGTEWTLALGGQNIAGSHFEGAVVTGTGTGSDYNFVDCLMGTVTLADGRMGFCALTGTLTMSVAGDYYLHDCYSGVAGAGTPIIDFGAAIANSFLSMRRYSGGIQINNKDNTGTDQMSLEGDGQLIVAATSSGAISLRGNWRVTNTGGATITYDSPASDVAAIESELIVVHSETTVIQSQTTVIESDSIIVESSVQAVETDTGNIYSDTTRLESDTIVISSDTAAIETGVNVSTWIGVVPNSLTAAGRLQVDVKEWGDNTVTGTGNMAQLESDSAVIESDVTRIELALIAATGTLEGTPSTTVLQTDLPEATDSHYVNMVFVMTSGDEAGEARRISAYTGSTGTVTLDTALSGSPTAAETFAILNIPAVWERSEVSTTLSDLVIVESDSVVIESSVQVAESNTVVLESDSIIVESSVQQLEQMVSDVESSLVIVKSDLVVIDAAVSDVESSLVIVKSDLVVATSDLAALESAVSDVESSLVIVKSDLVVATSDLAVVESSIQVAESDVALLFSAHAEPTGVPAANESPVDKVGYLFMALRNKVTVTSTKKTFFGDDDAAEFEKDLTDDGTTYTETEANTI